MQDKSKLYFQIPWLNYFVEIFDDEKFKEIYNKYINSDVFDLAIDLTYRNNKVHCKTSPNMNKLMGRLFENKKINILYDPTIGRG